MARIYKKSENMRPISFWDFLSFVFRIVKINEPVLKLLAGKIRALERISDTVATLVLGSSHAKMGWLARDGEFNLGLGYQDMYYTYCLYHKYRRLPMLKNVVVFFSVFSPGHQLIRTRDARACAAFKAVCGIEFQDLELGERLRLNRLRWLYKRKASEYLRTHSYEDGDLGNAKVYSPFPAATAANRALAHLKNNSRDFDMTCYLGRIAEEALECGHKVYVVLPPMTSEYRAAIPSGRELFAKLYECAEKYDNIVVLDHYDDLRFDSGDFVDWDHLSKEGGRKLTEIVRAEMHGSSVGLN